MQTNHNAHPVNSLISHTGSPSNQLVWNWSLQDLQGLSMSSLASWADIWARITGHGWGEEITGARKINNGMGNQQGSTAKQRLINSTNTYQQCIIQEKFHIKISWPCTLLLSPKRLQILIKIIVYILHKDYV